MLSQTLRSIASAAAAALRLLDEPASAGAAAAFLMPGSRVRPRRRLRDLLSEGGGLIARLRRSAQPRSRGNGGSRPASAASAAFPSRPGSTSGGRPLSSESASSASFASRPGHPDPTGGLSAAAADEEAPEYADFAEGDEEGDAAGDAEGDAVVESVRALSARGCSRSHQPLRRPGLGRSVRIGDLDRRDSD